MPIPILKGLKRCGPPVDPPRTPAPIIKSQSSSRPNARASSSVVGATSNPPSNIPSFHGGKETRGGRGTSTLKPGRGVVSPRAGGVHSPRPPPRISSAIVTSPKPPTRMLGNCREQENHIKIAHIKATESLPEQGSCFVPSNNLVIPVSSNSNRSSLISNSSSIPAPSSSSSNRNSNSSISSNFSVGSWNEERNYVVGGSDTFPRTSSSRRSFNTTEGLTSSVHVESPASSRQLIQKPSYKRGAKEVTKNNPHKLAPTSSLSSSESAIALPRASNEISNRSESNLSRLKAVDKPTITDFRNFSGRSIPKPSGTIRSSQANNNTTTNFNGHSYLPTTNRTADPNSNKAQQPHHHSETVQSPTLPLSRLQKSKQKNFQAKSKEDSRLLMKVMRNGNINSNFVDSTDEDDGYSSVAHTDHHEEEEVAPSVKSINDDYDEVEEMDEIEPMKPLEGLSRYSCVLNNKNSFFNKSQCAEDTSSADSATERNSMQQQFLEKPSPISLWNESSNLNQDPGKLQISNEVPDRKNPSSLKFESLSPRLVRPAESINKNSPVKTLKSRVGTGNIVLNTAVTNPRMLPPVMKTSNPSCSKEKSIAQTNNSLLSNLDDSILTISYKNFVKDTKPITSKDNYSWLARNTISESVPVTPPRRRSDIASSSTTSTQSTFTSPSLPTLTSSRVGEETKSAPPTRPSSFASPGKLNFNRASFSSASTLSPQFYRSGSLRSPKEDPTSTSSDRKITYPGTSNSLAGSPTSGIKSFVRNSPKYSTVIPRTLKQDMKTTNYTTECNKSKNGQQSSVGFISNNTAKHSATSNYSDEHSYRASAEDYEALERELKAAKEKVFSMTEQLNSSSKLVAAYEHSLSNMTQRLQQLTKITEQKDTEAAELRRLLERACLDSAGTDSRSSTLRSRMNRSSSIESMTSLNSNASFSSAVSSTSSSVSFASNSSTCEEGRDKSSIKKKSWLRSSFSKAFKRREKRKRSDILPLENSGRLEPLSGDIDSLGTPAGPDMPGFRGFCSLPSSPLPQRYLPQILDDAYSDVDSNEKFELKICALKEDISRLKKMLREKDTALTESRLESLSAAHQIEALKESIHQLSTELSAMRMERDEPDRPTSPTDGLLIGYEYNNGSASSFEQSRLSSRLSFTKSENEEIENGKSVKIFIPRNDYDKGGLGLNYFDVPAKRSHLGDVTIYGTTSWEQLDDLINKVFEKYLNYIDPVSKLALDCDSILHYQLGEVLRTPMLETPELLPCGYIVGDVDSIDVILQTPSLNSIDSIAFETLFSKSHLQRYVNMLKEHRRIILTGPEGSGKSFLAHRLAEFVVQRLGIEPSLGNIAKFNINEQTSEDLSTYLSQISDLCETKSTDLPLVIIIESLEKVDRLSEILIASLRVPHDQCPFIIGTLRHCGRRNSTIKINFNFRLITLDPMQDPICNILPRLCRRNLQLIKSNPEISSENLGSLFEWLPRCWYLVNKVLESSSSSFGPGVLLPIPFSLNDAQLWFFDIWKRLLLPKLQEAAEKLSPLPADIENWQELDKCLGEQLPWSPSNNVTLPGINSAK